MNDGAARRAPACALVIFGASGDLTERKLLPAIRQRAAHRRLRPESALIGAATPPRPFGTMEPPTSFHPEAIRGGKVKLLCAIPLYHAATWGPQEATQLIQRDGRQWRNP